MTIKHTRRIVRITRELIRRFYMKKDNVCGGVLHILTDDGNITDGSINFCIGRAREERDGDADRIARNMLAMTMHERAECLHIDVGGECFAEQVKYAAAENAKATGGEA